MIQQSELCTLSYVLKHLAKAAHTSLPNDTPKSIPFFPSVMPCVWAEHLYPLPFKFQIPLEIKEMQFINISFQMLMLYPYINHETQGCL